MNSRQEDMMGRLREARAALAGLNHRGEKATPSMFDPGVISLAHGDGVRRPHCSVISAGVSALLDASNGSLDDYLFMQRHEPLEMAIYHLFQRRGIPDRLSTNVVVDFGTTRLFAGFLHACAEDGDVFLVPRAYYHVLPVWCELARVSLRLVPTTLDTHFKLSAEALNEWFTVNNSVAARVRGLFLFNPTQTGALYTPDELRRLGAVIAQRDLVVLEDNIFAGTEFAGHRTVPLAASCPEVGDRVLTVMGASKAHNLANVRVGWACGNARVVERIADYRENTIGNVPHIIQSMALAALQAPESYLRENSDECAKRVALVERLVAHCNTCLMDSWDAPPLAVVHPPEAGHGVLISLPSLARRSRETGISNSIDVTRMLLSRAGVAVSPGYSIGFDETEVRLALGSVGLKSTYASAQRAEAASALAAAASYLGDVKRVGRGLSDILRDIPAEPATDPFVHGRQLIEHAFLDRILPALLRAPNRGHVGRGRATANR